MNNKLILGLLLIMLYSLSACVPARKHQELQKAKAATQKDLNACESELAKFRSQNEQQTQRIAYLDKNIGYLRQDSAIMIDRYNRVETANKDLLGKYDRLIATNDGRVSDLSSQLARLNDELNRKQKELEAKERALGQSEQQINNNNQQLQQSQLVLEQKEVAIKEQETALQQSQSELAAKEQAINELKQSLEEREKRVNELEAAIAAKEARLNELRQRINSALRGFQASDLTVTEKNGKVYVSLSQDLLFAKGSKTIDAKGKDALKKLAEVLNKNTDITITVEGHTDTDGAAANNWDLSVLRATSILKELEKNSVDPKRLIASGRGQYFPIAPNSDNNGKAQNRRSEIILSPKLDVLYNIIGN